MPAAAMRDVPLPQIPPFGVLAGGNNLKVIGIDAGCDFAQMVDLHAIGNWLAKKFVSNPVGHFIFATNSNLSVTGRCGSYPHLTPAFGNWHAVTV